jgi:hypothetical protein
MDNSNEAQGVHSLTDVPVFAMGPCSENFGGVYSNIDIFFNMAECLGLARGSSAPGGAVPSDNSTIPTSTAVPENGVQRGLLVGMLVFQAAIGWAVYNM